MKLSTKICAATAPLGLLLALVSPGALATTVSACDAVTGNLVANCGFESIGPGGVASNWSEGLNTDYEYSIDNDGDGAHSGNGEFVMGAGVDNFAAGNQVFQTLVTSMGTAYTLDYFMTNGNANNGFRALWDGNAITGSVVTGLYESGWTEFTFPGLIASGPSTVLEFDGYAPIGYNYLDDVSVVVTGSVTPTPPSNNVPEPPAAPLFGLGLSGIGFMLVMRRRRHKDEGTTEPR